VSTAVTFEQFVRPALRRMMGFAALHRPVIRARLVDGYRKKAGRLHFVRVALEPLRSGRSSTMAGRTSWRITKSRIAKHTARCARMP